MRKISFLLTIGIIINIGLQTNPCSAENRVRFDRNWGFYNQQSYSHIDLRKARREANEKADVPVAVIDTGVDTRHKEIQVVDSKNFVDGSAMSDENGHGTHVTGIITAISSRAKITALKYYREENTGQQNLSNLVKAIDYAINQNVKIINVSGGGPQYAHTEYLALKRAQDKGILVICAAGNRGENVELPQNTYYPAGYALANIISVAATDINSKLVRSSNWSRFFVLVAAPGENIFSTLPRNRYGYMSGTSQATAFVTGIASLIWSIDPSLTSTEVKDIVVQSSQKKATLYGRVKFGLVNAHAAIKMLKSRRLPKSESAVSWNTKEPQ